MNQLARDDGDSWLIDVGGWQITQCAVDYAFSVHCDGGQTWVDFRISGQFVVRDDDGASHTIDVETDGPAAVVPALRMLHQIVEEARAFKDGTLVIRTENGLVLTAPPNPRYEAWTISSKLQEITMVSQPGGGLAIWTQP